MARVIRTPRANEDLIGIWTYVAEADEEKADRLLVTIRDKCQLLAERPGAGRERNELIIGLRSFPVSRYVIFYQPVADGIEVLRVLHGSRDIQSEFDIWIE